MEHRKADVRPAAGFGASGDDAARFLDELRQLRSGAGLGHAELAARAHYPYDSIRAAEVGPSLPDLPVLSAFVRGCGGTTEEWEERWRSLTKSPSLPVAAARQSSRSDAANAGARIHSGTQGESNPDPSIIMAALSRVAEGMATPGEATSGAGTDETPEPGAAQAPAAFPPPAAPVPTAPTAPLPHDQRWNGQPGNGSKAAGWDPIRVSSAWPVLQHTPTVTEPLRNTASPGGAGVPWGEAPWTEDPGAPVTGAAGGRAPAAERKPPTALLVVAALILLCALIVALAVFA